LNLLDEEASPERMIRKLERIFDEDAKEFVKSLWRFILFEQLQLKYMKQE